MFEQALREN